MPVGCQVTPRSDLKRNASRVSKRVIGRYHPRTQATPRKDLKRNASRVSSDATVGLEKKCQSGVHKSSGVINRLKLEGRHKRT